MKVVVSKLVLVEVNCLSKWPVYDSGLKQYIDPISIIKNSHMHQHFKMRLPGLEYTVRVDAHKRDINFYNGIDAKKSITPSIFMLLTPNTEDNTSIPIPVYILHIICYIRIA
jgi:hypothetical protein